MALAPSAGAELMQRAMAVAVKFLAREEGPTIAEYGLLVAVVAVVAAVGAATLGTDLSDLFSSVGSMIRSYAP